MKQRVISAIIAAAIFLPFVFAGGKAFSLFIFMLACIGLFELTRMQGIRLISLFGFISLFALYYVVVPRAYMSPFFANFNPEAVYYIAGILLLAFTVFDHLHYNFVNVATIMFAALYIGFGFRFLIVLRDMGLDLIVYQFLIIWSTDIGAYFIGRKWGKRKLAPEISPNKTIEGSLGGILVAILMVMSYRILFTPNLGGANHYILMSIFVSMFGQLGDLVESSYKRYFRVKDSGNLIPGHGGILDRFDSNLFTSFIMMVWFTLLK